MAHYAFLDENNIVINVIVGKDEGETDWEAYYADKTGQTCKRTSYNTHAGEHRLGGTPFRKNYAGIGYIYDPARDAFLPPPPYNSWVVNEDTCQWVAPEPQPNDGQVYIWDEDTISWKLATQ